MSPRKEMIAALREWADGLPPDVRRIVVDSLDRDFEVEIEREIAEVEAQLSRILPDKGTGKP